MHNKDSLSHLNQLMNRRSFLKTSALLTLGIMSGTALEASAESLRFNSTMYKVSNTRLGIGTFVSITLIHDSQDQAEEAIELTFEEIDRLVAIMNRFDGKTALSELNLNGMVNSAPPELIDVIKTALYYNRLSGGLFDITVKPVLDLFMKKLGRDKKEYPDESQLCELLPLIGSEKVLMAGNTVSFREKGMGITLDGIAKGYIVDKAAAILNDQGISNYMIAAGGEIRTRGTKSDRTPWKIAIQDPQKANKYPDIIAMTEGSISTSGNYEVYFDQEKMFHHIVDPSSGRSPLFCESVSVIANSNTAADALATAAFVMGAVGGIEFINSIPGCECLMVKKGGSISRSTGWKSTVTL